MLYFLIHSDVASPLSPVLITDPKIVECSLVLVLGCETSVGKIAIDSTPFSQSPIIEHLKFVGNDEWHNACIEALLEHHKPSHSAIAVLKGVDALEADMKVENVIKIVPTIIVVGKQSLHLLFHLLWGAGCLSAHLVWQALVFTHGKPTLATVRGATL